MKSYEVRQNERRNKKDIKEKKKVILERRKKRTKIKKIKEGIEREGR